jgi:hypothetical protein
MLPICSLWWLAVRHDEDSQHAMVALANSSVVDGRFGSQYSTFEGNLRAMGQSKMEKTLQVPQMQELANTLSSITERPGFDLPSLCKVLNNLMLQLNSNDSKDLKSLVDLLFLHDFLLSQT